MHIATAHLSPLSEVAEAEEHAGCRRQLGIGCDQFHYEAALNGGTGNDRRYESRFLRLKAARNTSRIPCDSSGWAPNLYVSDELRLRQSPRNRYYLRFSSC